jgi:hypothetical protein
MHRRLTVWTSLTRFLVGFGTSLALLIAVPAVMAEDQPAGPNTPSDREAFLAGTVKDCPGCDLREAKLKRRNLSGADLSGADLSGAVLHRAKLDNARLDHAKLQDADLSKADLKRGSLTGADLSEALLYGTDPTGAQPAQEVERSLVQPPGAPSR